MNVQSGVFKVIYLDFLWQQNRHFADRVHDSWPPFTHWDSWETGHLWVTDDPEVNVVLEQGIEELDEEELPATSHSPPWSLWTQKKEGKKPRRTQELCIQVDTAFQHHWTGDISARLQWPAIKSAIQGLWEQFWFLAFERDLEFRKTEWH